MRLQLIVECHPRCLIETRHGWADNSNDLAAEQSAKNLVYMALTKIRNMLMPMGLVKSGPQKTREPIGPAVGPFDGLRRAVQTKAQQDAASLIQGTGNRKKIGNFWGFQVPTNLYDIEASPHGTATATGQFDNMIRQTVAAAKGQPAEVRVNLLGQLTQSLM